VFLDAITHGWVGPPRTGGILLLATCAVACASTPPAPFTPPDPCTRVVPAIDGPVFTGPEGRLGRPFSLVVPEAFSPVDGMGIDSEVRLWVDGSGNAIFYDYSASISQPFLRSHLARYLECRDTVGGRAATLAVGRDTAGTMANIDGAARFVAVATWSRLDGGPQMSIIVTSLDAAGFDHGLAILRSVRFPEGGS